MIPKMAQNGLKRFKKDLILNDIKISECETIWAQMPHCVFLGLRVALHSREGKPRDDISHSSHRHIGKQKSRYKLIYELGFFDR